MNTLNLASIAIILKIPCLRLATILLVFAMGKLSNLFECVCFGVFYLSRTYSCISQCNTIFNKPFVLLRAHLSGLSITTKNNKKSNCVGQLIPKQCPTLFSCSYQRYRLINNESQIFLIRSASRSRQHANRVKLISNDIS